jgi:hypothetical protein
VRFGGAEIGRLVLGCNPIYGWSHFNKILSAHMAEWYTPDRVAAVLHQCNRYGINAYNTGLVQPAGLRPRALNGRQSPDWVPPVVSYRNREVLDRLEADGGKMHLVLLVQEGLTLNRDVQPDLVAIAKTLRPLAMYYGGDTTDRAFQTGTMDEIREWTKKARDTGVKVGVCSHNPEVIEMVEEQGWDIDFYFACVYQRTRTPGEFRKMFNGELPVGEHDIYLAADPPRMYKVIRQTKKHCFAFKILAAGRISDDEAEVDRAFQQAFASIKPTDCVCVGMFPKLRDQVRENVERVARIVSRGGIPPSAG